MRAKAILCTLLIVALVTGAGCESMRQTFELATDIVEQNPELIQDEEDRQKWLAGASAVKAWTGKIDVPEEVAMGQSLAVRTFAGYGPPHSDAELQEYVASIGELVGLQSERPSLPYSFAVVTSDAPNALALPGGYVFVSTGLLRMLESESELAAILGHEIAHVAQKHGVEIVGRDRRIARLVDFGALLEEEVAEYREFIDRVYEKLTTEGYDRRYEVLADEAGTRYAWRAGYHPEGLLPFLQADLASPEKLAFETYKTHPDPAERIAAVRGVLAGLPHYGNMPRLADRYKREVLSKLR